MKGAHQGHHDQATTAPKPEEKAVSAAGYGIEDDCAVMIAVATDHNITKRSDSEKPLPSLRGSVPRQWQFNDLRSVYGFRLVGVKGGFSSADSAIN